MIVLDIDFDFFVRENPCLDWGHGERGLVGVMGDILWRQRAISAISRGIDLGDWQHSPHDPAPEHFWDYLKGLGWDFSELSLIIVGDSHAQTAHKFFQQWSEYIHWFEDTEIYHLDAHHDMGYDHTADAHCEAGGLDCDNWLRTFAHHLANFDNLHVIYPHWRNEDGGYDRPAECYELDAYKLEQHMVAFEEQFGMTVSYGYGIDKFDPPNESVDILMLTKSSAWTPPWCDDAWKAFLTAAPDPPNTELVEDTAKRWEAGNWPDVVEMLAPEAEAMAAVYDNLANIATRQGVK